MPVAHKIHVFGVSDPMQCNIVSELSMDVFE